MSIHKKMVLCIFSLFSAQLLCAMPLAEEFKEVGYIEICDKNHGTATFDALYACFDVLIEFLQTNRAWAEKLYAAKERFIRSKDRNYYSTDFFGFYDESKKKIRSQISFYYSPHFHNFMSSHYPEFNQIPEIIRFFDACFALQKPYTEIFQETATALGLSTIFSSEHREPPILLKVIKYLPSYSATKPHYDGTAFSLFLDSTDNQSLLLSPYKSSFGVNDFSSPLRTFPRSYHQNSIVLIPGALLTEFSIYPTPHVVAHSGKTRYATIAFAMRPHHTPQKNTLSALPNLND